MAPSRQSCTAAAGLGGLAVVELEVAVSSTGRSSYLEVLVLVLSTAGAITGARLLRANCFESRLATVVLTGVALAGALLSGTTGLPGRTPHGLTPTAVVVMVLCLAIIALIWADSSRQRTGPVRPPYAL